MNWRLFFITFGSIFLAELGDKTQLATISFTADNVKYKWLVFAAAASALVLTTFLGVFFGHILTKYIPPKYIKISAGLLFVIIGVLMLINVMREKEDSRTAKATAAIIEEIKRVQSLEKCGHCGKFNAMLAEKKTIIGEDILPLETTHSPYNCEKCNTDKIKKMFNS